MINVAIVGTGAISPSHIQSYLEFPERCKIVALCDIYPEKAEKKAAEFELSASIYSNHEEMLEKEDLHLISVCTPPYTHAEISVNALNKGRNVLIEKPMASSLDECDLINAAAEKNGKMASVVAQNRFTNPMMKLKKVLDTKLMGPILHTQVDSFWWRGHNYYDLWWRGTWEKEGGGCTLNHAVHHIDLMKWMNGMPKEVTAITSNAAHDNAEVEDISVAICKYESGALAQITSSVIHHGEEQQMIFQGKNARVSAPWKVTASVAKGNGFPEEDSELEEKLETFYKKQENIPYEGHKGQIFNVLQALAGEDDLLIDGVQGRETLELISAIYQSAAQGKTVQLPLKESEPFYTRKGILENTTFFYEKNASVENFDNDEITTGGNYE